MMNYETAPRGPKAPVCSRSSHEREDDLHDWITTEIVQAAKRLESRAVVPNYSVVNDLDDLESVGEQFLEARAFTKELQHQAFEYLLMTPIRAKANRSTRRLNSKLRQKLDINNRKDQTDLPSVGARLSGLHEHSNHQHVGKGGGIRGRTPPYRRDRTRVPEEDGRHSGVRQRGS